jgi:Reverse transcriptase (RNA-dependent DNA polymerase)
VINVRLYNYFKNLDLFSKNQHGFLKGKSTITAVYEFLDSVLEGLDTQHYDLGIFLDLSKAYECVDPEELIRMFERYGIRGIPLNLLKNYMVNRKQYVYSKNEKGEVSSALLNNNCGIVQGSLVGPLFFLIYVNNLEINNENIELTQYADDTSANIKSKNKNELIDTGKKFVAEINAWFKQKKLKLNASKSVIIYFQLSSWRDMELNEMITCEGKEIEIANSAKLLGIIVDQNISWNEHINKLCKKLGRSVYALRILKNIVSKNVIIQIYYAYFHSILSYGIELWGNAAAYLTNRVFRLQKKVIRIIENLRPLDSCREVFKALGILPLPALYIYKTVIFLKQNPQYFLGNTKTHRYDTRNKGLYDVECHRTTAREKGLHYSAIKFFNNLPQSLRDENNVNKLKQKLKSLLLNKKVYSLKDFYDLKEK